MSKYIPRNAVLKEMQKHLRRKSISKVILDKPKEKLSQNVIVSEKPILKLS